MEQDSAADQYADQPTKRWGDGSAKYEKPVVSKKLLTSDDRTLTLTVKARIMKDMENPVAGFSIKNASGVQLLGTNSQIKKQPIRALKAGDYLTVSWIIDNNFGEGRHFVDCAFVHHDGSVVADWWEESVQFNVINEEKTPYMTAPPISLSLKIDQSRIQ